MMFVTSRKIALMVLRVSLGFGCRQILCKQTTLLSAQLLIPFQQQAQQQMFWYLTSARWD